MRRRQAARRRADERPLPRKATQLEPTATPDINILQVSVANGSVQLSTGPQVLAIIGVVFVLLAIVYVIRASGDRVVNVNVVLPFTGGNISIARDRQVARIAHQAWIEIVTRKAGQPFDEDNDVIDEVFDSWYELFRELRALAKSVPPESLGTRNSRRMTELLVDALNNGLRPVLTRWQARYRAWYSVAKEARPSDDPQSIQRDFPHYDEMMAEVRVVSAEMVKFAASLHSIERGFSKRGNTGPT